MRRVKLVVTVAFEPGRLGAQAIADAYAQIVPIYKRRIQSAAASGHQPGPVIWRYRRVNR
jgi:hypothetical protein